MACRIGNAKVMIEHVIVERGKPGNEIRSIFTELQTTGHPNFIHILCQLNTVKGRIR